LLWTLPEAARYWGLARSTVFRKVRLGQIPAFRLHDHYVIPRDVVNGLPVPMEVAKRWTEMSNAGWHSVVPEAITQWMAAQLRSEEGKP
jgi:excisionase family DNA binding protein